MLIQNRVRSLHFRTTSTTGREKRILHYSIHIWRDIKIYFCSLSNIKVSVTDNPRALPVVKIKVTQGLYTNIKDYPRMSLLKNIYTLSSWSYRATIGENFREHDCQWLVYWRTSYHHIPTSILFLPSWIWFKVQSCNQGSWVPSWILPGDTKTSCTDEHAYKR